MMDKYLSASRSKGAVRWDDLRSRRTWDRMVPRLQDSEPESEFAPSRHRPWLVPAVAAACAAGIVVLVLVFLRSSTPSTDAFSPPVASSRRLALAPDPVPRRAPETPIAVVRNGDAILTLFDGSQASASAEARFKLVSAAEHSIVIKQTRGLVAYAVTPNSRRTFVVKAHGVIVKVLGTLFSVNVGTDQVQVSVTRGRVLASDAYRQVVLHGGESVTLRGSFAPRDDQGRLAQNPMPMVQGTPRKRVRPALGPVETGSLKEILKKVDEARRAGRFTEAIGLLRRATMSPDADPDKTTAFFILARMELSVGSCGAAAKAYRSYLNAAPRGTFAMDALAGEVKARWRCGQKARARALAREYLRRYPKTLHASVMHGILKE